MHEDFPDEVVKHPRYAEIRDIVAGCGPAEVELKGSRIFSGFKGSRTSTPSWNASMHLHSKSYKFLAIAPTSLSFQKWVNPISQVFGRDDFPMIVLLLKLYVYRYVS